MERRDDCLHSVTVQGAPVLFGIEGEVQGRWIAFAGKKLRLHANYPNSEQFEAHATAISKWSGAQAKPLDTPPVLDNGELHRLSRACVAEVMTGLEFEGEYLTGYTPENWKERALACGPFGDAFLDLAGFLFRGAAVFCDDGSGATEGASGT